MDIISVQGDVQFAERHLGALELQNALLHAARQRDPTGAQANQDQRMNSLVALDDLMGQSSNGAPNIVGAKQQLPPRFVGQRTLLRGLTGPQLKDFPEV